jgi:aryl-alcohol dehydrogenase-like predicted oxidoreductase
MDLASIARGILGMGLLTGKYTAENYTRLLAKDDYRRRIVASYIPLFGKLDKVREILTSKGRTIPQGALAWIWARSDRSIPIPGFRTFDQVKENIAAMDYGPLTSEEMAQIDVLLEREK